MMGVTHRHTGLSVIAKTCKRMLDELNALPAIFDYTELNALLSSSQESKVDVL